MTGIASWGKIAPAKQCLLAISLNVRYTWRTIMAEKQFIEMRGSVEEALPGGQFRIKLENEQVIIGHLSGKLRKFRIRIMPGDDIKVEISPYDLTKGRITYRF